MWTSHIHISTKYFLSLNLSCDNCLDDMRSISAWTGSRKQLVPGCSFYVPSDYSHHKPTALWLAGDCQNARVCLQPSPGAITALLSRQGSMRATVASLIEANYSFSTASVAVAFFLGGGSEALHLA